MRKILIFTLKKVQAHTGVINFYIKTNNPETGRYPLSQEVNAGIPQPGSVKHKKLSGEFIRVVKKSIDELNLKPGERANCQLKFNKEDSFTFAPEILKEGQYRLFEEERILPLGEEDINFFCNCLNNAIVLL